MPEYPFFKIQQNKELAMIRHITLMLLLAMAMPADIWAQVVLRYGAEMDAGWGDASSVVTPYVTFPTKFISPYAGNRITKIRIGVKSEGTNVYPYIKQKPSDTQYIFRQKIDGLLAGWNEIALETPFDITGTDDIAIGYKASFAQAGGVGYSAEKFSDGDFVYYNSKNKWTSTGGSVCIQAVVEGDQLPMNEMLMGRMSSHTAPYEARTMTFTGVVRNVGGNDIENYTLRYTMDDEETLLDIDRPVAINASDTFDIEVPSDVPGVHRITVNIEKVNGETPSYAANDTVTATLTVRDKAFMRRVVCEEYGGTWCGFCPRGIVGLELMKEMHPEQFIAISAHGGDELEIDPSTGHGYDPFISSCSGAPMCNVDRKLTGDPYIDIQNLFNMESASECHIAYAVSAEWNADSTAINVKSEFYSDIDVANPLYHVAYTVTEDSITGYAQLNYYAGGRNGSMYGWEDKEEYTTDFYYNDLARGIYPNYQGDLCRDEDMVAYTKYAHTSTIPLPATVEDKRQIHIVGQIIDNRTGYILNAMSAVPVGRTTADIIQTVADNDMTSISKTDEGILITISGHNGTPLHADVYDLAGTRTNSTLITEDCTPIVLRQKGAYIIHIYDGQRTLRTTKIIY